MGRVLFCARHKLISFTDARVFNFTVYDENGSVLIAMTGFELKRNSTSFLPDIERRYEVVLQPIVTPVVLPRCATHWSRPDKEIADLIATIADRETQLLLRQTLDRGVTVGDDIDRQRYHQFAKNATTRYLPPLPSPSIVEDIKRKWPIRFQIVDRLSRVHREVFKTSTVSRYLSRYHEVILICSTPGNRSGPTLRRYLE